MSHRRTKLRPTYSNLQVIFDLMSHPSKYRITLNCLEGAYNSFKFGKNDVISAFLQASSRRFLKSEPANLNPKLWMDYYRISYLGHDIFYKFYVTNDTLCVITSCKEFNE